MRSVVINLDRSADRLAWFLAQATALGLAVERLPAVDGQRLSAEDCAALRGAGDSAQALTVGEIACFLSHRAAWRTLAESRDEWLAVFEDDVHLAPEAARFLLDPGWIPAGVGLVKIETTLDDIRIAASGVRTLADRRLYRLFSMHAGSAAYILSRRSAALLLAQTATLPGPVDHVLFDPLYPAAPDLAVRQLVPALCVQDCFLSRQEPHRAQHQSIIEHSATRPAQPAGQAAGKRKPTLGRKLLRETVRPARQLAGGLAALSIFLFRNETRWKQQIVRFA